MYTKDMAKIILQRFLLSNMFQLISTKKFIYPTTSNQLPKGSMHDKRNSCFLLVTGNSDNKNVFMPNDHIKNKSMLRNMQ